MTDSLLAAIAGLLAIVASLLVALLIQQRRHQAQLIEWIDRYAQMVGDAIGEWRDTRGGGNGQ